MTKRLLALGSVFAGFLWVTSLSGCASGCGDIDDEVFIQKALEHFVVMQQGPAIGFLQFNLYSRDKSPSDGSYVTPDSVDAFLAENPDCCKFSYRGAEGWLPNWQRRISNDYVGVVSINYALRRSADGVIFETIHQAEIPINSCGEPIELSKIRAGLID
ncbi:MAG: hypothetical protein L3J37_10040 [Rhodobacteraceae bacterium]|nr:hypothetical protein [Paracoccaceae bacterium]